MWDARLIVSSVLRAIVACALSFVLLCAADVLILLVLRQFVEGEAVFYVLLLGFVLLWLTAAGALIFGVYVGVATYRKMTRSRGGGSETFAS
jgi:hypothetical protein